MSVCSGSSGWRNKISVSVSVSMRDVVEGDKEREGGGEGATQKLGSVRRFVAQISIL